MSKKSYCRINFFASQPIIDITSNPISNDVTSYESGKIFAGIGSRETPVELFPEITKLSRKLAEKGWILRSGGAEGADTAFEKGYDDFTNRKEIYLPWAKFNNHPSSLYRISEEAFMIAKHHHPAWHKCNDAAKKLLARNTFQILGYNLNKPCNLVICWTKDGKEDGGTGQALRVAKAYGIRIVNLATIGPK